MPTIASVDDLITAFPGGRLIDGNAGDLLTLTEGASQEYGKCYVKEDGDGEICQVWGVIGAVRYEANCRRIFPAVWGHTSSDSRVHVYEGAGGYHILNVSTQESKPMGDGMGMFSNGGMEIYPATLEFEEALSRDVDTDTDTYLEAYFGEGVPSTVETDTPTPEGAEGEGEGEEDAEE